MKNIFLGMVCVLLPALLYSMEKKVAHAIGEIVSFADEDVQQLEEKPTVGSMVLMRCDSDYRWVKVQWDAKGNDVGVIEKKEGNRSYGNVVSLHTLYRHIENEKNNEKKDL